MKLLNDVWGLPDLPDSYNAMNLVHILEGMGGTLHTALNASANDWGGGNPIIFGGRQIALAFALPSATQIIRPDISFAQNPIIDAISLEVVSQHLFGTFMGDSKQAVVSSRRFSTHIPSDFP